MLFRSVAQNVGPNAVGVILTGMGDDGARGLKEMLDAGARTMAQDEASSVVWGMPGAAVKLGGAQDILPLGRVAEHIMRLAQTVGAPAIAAATLERERRNGKNDHDCGRFDLDAADGESHADIGGIRRRRSTRTARKRSTTRATIRWTW